MTDENREKVIADIRWLAGGDLAEGTKAVLRRAADLLEADGKELAETAGYLDLMTTRCLDAERRLRELEEGLRPFAKRAEDLGERDWGMMSVHIEDLRRACALLSQSPDAQNPEEDVTNKGGT